VHYHQPRSSSIGFGAGFGAGQFAQIRGIIGSIDRDLRYDQVRSANLSHPEEPDSRGIRVEGQPVVRTLLLVPLGFLHGDS